MMKIKLCGFTDAESIKAAVKNKCDFLGFVFYKNSPRYVELSAAKTFVKLIPNDIKKVAIVVDPELDFLEKINSEFQPDFFQFHGSEDIYFLTEVRKKFPSVKIIKAFKINSTEDLNQIDNFNDYCDFFLFDNKNAGSGKKFNWEILRNFSCKKDWFLSGGININNIEEAIKTTGARFIDTSSGIEEMRGKKSAKLIEALMNQINNVIKS